MKDKDSSILPLKHPSTVIFAKGDYYTKDITEEIIYRYYKSVASQIVEELNGAKLMTVIRVDGKDIIKKHFDGKNNATAINTVEEFNDIINTGRMIEVHRIIRESEKFAVIDIDPRPKVPFETTKKLAEDITTYFSQRGNTALDNIQVYFSGHRGFHIYLNYAQEFKVKLLAHDLKDDLDDFLNKRKDPKIMLHLPKNDDEIRLDTTIYHPDGAIRLPYSLHKDTGLACIPVQNIRTFTPEQAKITKFIKLAVQVLRDAYMNVPTIGVDFDNTLWKQEGDSPYQGHIDSKIAEFVHKCKESGYDIIILTSRIVNHPDDVEFIAETLEDAGVPFDEITSQKKPEIEHIIDDKAETPEEIGTFLNLRAAKLKITGPPPSGVPANQFPRITKNYKRFRQFPPSKCKPGTFWMKKIKNGDQLVMCTLKSSGKEAVQSKMVRKKGGSDRNS